MHKKVNFDKILIHQVLTHGNVSSYGSVAKNMFEKHALFEFCLVICSISHQGQGTSFHISFTVSFLATVINRIGMLSIKGYQRLCLKSYAIIISFLIICSMTHQVMLHQLISQ